MQDRVFALLLWSAVSFLTLGCANVVLFLDLVLYQEIDLVSWRSGFTLCAILVLLFGLIYESK